MPVVTSDNPKDALALSLLVEAQGRALCEAFGRAQVPLVLLKGIGFARTLYADPTERTMTDIDLLVAPADVVRAGECLRALGYVPDASPASRLGFGAVIEKTWRRPGHLPVELHRAVATGHGAARLSAHILANAQPAPAPYDFPGVGIARPEAALVALALHFRDHGLSMADYQAEDVRRLADWADLDPALLDELAALATARLALARMLMAAGCAPDRVRLPLKLVAKQRALSLLLKQEGTGFAPRVPIDRIRAGERVWRLCVHLWAGRDCPLESAVSQLEHLRFEAGAVSAYLRDRFKSH